MFNFIISYFEWLPPLLYIPVLALVAFICAVVLFKIVTFLVNIITNIVSVLFGWL